MNAITLKKDSKGWSMVTDPDVPYATQQNAFSALSSKTKPGEKLVLIPFVNCTAVDGDILEKQRKWFEEKAKKAAESGKVNAKTAEEKAAEAEAIKKADAAKIKKIEAQQKEGNENTKKEFLKAHQRR